MKRKWCQKCRVLRVHLIRASVFYNDSLIQFNFKWLCLNCLLATLKIDVYGLDKADLKTLLLAAVDLQGKPV